jgi:nucleoid DNA-binding protein
MAENVNKADIVRAIIGETPSQIVLGKEISLKYMIDWAYTCFIEAIIKSLIDGKTVNLRGLGTLSVYETEETKGYDINTGTTTIRPPRRRIRFQISKSLIANLDLLQELDS